MTEHMLPNALPERPVSIARGRRPLVFALAVACLLGAGPLAAQQDSTKHDMHGMPGMKPPAPKKPAPKKPAAKKPDAKKAPQPAAAKPDAPPKDSLPGVRPDSAGHPAPPVVPPAPDTTHAAMPGMHHDSTHAVMPAMDHDTIPSAMPGMAPMQMIDGPLGIPMERTGSGTSWLPDDSPMHADHVMRGPWELMLHGVAFAMYDKQGSRRGDEQFSSVNWGMLMATRNAGGGRLQLRGMVSAEPWTVGGQGYPLLLQTGETYRGEPLHDRQHPHDLFMEVAGLYEHAVSNRLGLSLYVAPVGEPAIGPVAYPHRPSAMNDPMAPISHHWQDATHISFGVLTAAIFTHSVRLEGSIFNGREPDENRTNVDYRGRSLDSYAGRVAWNPSPHWSASAGYAYLRSPESSAPDDAVHRISGSVMNGRTFGEHGELATSFVFGANRHSEGGHLEPSYLLESNLEFGGAHSIFGRAEYVRKGADDLVLGPLGPTGEFDLTSVVAGYVYEFDRAGTVRTGIGARASVDLIPAALEPVYGSRAPGGFAIYVRFRPQRMSEGHDKRMTAPKSSGAHEGHAGHR